MCSGEEERSYQEARTSHSKLATYTLLQYIRAHHFWQASAHRIETRSKSSCRLKSPQLNCDCCELVRCFSYRLFWKKKNRTTFAFAAQCAMNEFEVTWREKESQTPTMAMRIKIKKNWVALRWGSNPWTLDSHSDALKDWSWATETLHLNHHIQLRYHLTADNGLGAWLSGCSNPKLAMAALRQILA